MDQLRASVTRYCTEIGQDPLLVQGAGGNVSWKDGDTLWVKASGTWLADASKKDIFVPVDLHHLRHAVEIGNFSVTPKLSGSSTLKPSIETLLHALMPHRVVAHLHAIEALAYLVRHQCEHALTSSIGNAFSWNIVDYYKPGAELAAAIGGALAKRSGIDVIFLKNHGVVIGGDDVTQIKSILDGLIHALENRPADSGCKRVPNIKTRIEQYIPASDENVHQLAFDMELFNRLRSDWALYPDHVVFLGPKAHTFETWEALDKALHSGKEPPELVFIKGEGVFVRAELNRSKAAQLRCYHDVLVRQHHGVKLNPLTEEQIANLLNWDAERYRMNLAK